MVPGIYKRMGVLCLVFALLALVAFAPLGRPGARAPTSSAPLAAICVVGVICLGITVEVP